MRKSLSILTLLLSTLLAGCGKPVPPEKASYVGVWQEEAMYLAITQDGNVNYKRFKDGVETSISGPLKGFSGNNLEVGIGPLSTTFEVSKPPFQEEGTWKMVVDNVVLTRNSQ